MRLLNVYTMKLEEFFDSEYPNDDDDSRFPKYAILSHCWGQDEVTFNDINGDSWQEKLGSKKINFTCRQAEEDGYGYAWVDTCCIDKSSSAELSEAINSMYRWYERSSACYAYIDVSPDSKDRSRSLSRASKKGFKDSRWFTRGWTLQELIAPNRLIFYDREWSVLGTKDELAGGISKITRIPANIILGKTTVASASVAQRMSWAATRETTRAEDKAYCLLGLFNVNMPLLYGEGVKAFIRLQEEIMKGSDDHSIFAWKSLRVESTGALASSPSCFKDSGNIVPFRHPPGCKPYSMTNRGLQIELPILPIKLSKYHTDYTLELRDLTWHIAMLDCQEEGSLLQGVGVLLRQPAGSDVFHRWSLDPLRKYQSGERAKAEPRTIYISEPGYIQQQYRTGKDIIHCAINFRHQHQLGQWYVEDTLKDCQWDEMLQTMQIPYSHLHEPEFEKRYRLAATAFTFVNYDYSTIFERRRFNVIVAVRKKGWERGADTCKCSVKIAEKPGNLALEAWFRAWLEDEERTFHQNPYYFESATVYTGASSTLRVSYNGGRENGFSYNSEVGQEISAQLKTSCYIKDMFGEQVLLVDIEDIGPV
ncbi:hypothetical protein G7Y89_g4974 [Cudoniella acicularis]|uniref:Heterokaryon incompatibility domain-containing protein n=1 Tax=Cudoniella acicularis TaxID=354080 RepID=A0A8H4W3T2_9HELO|nr:hypothetical protein G7Y89_g4974 [Cudoniella acicularis]